MRLNIKTNLFKKHTHGGAPAFAPLTPYQELRRSVLACLLWEDEFYESGQTIGKRIAKLAEQVSTPELCALALEARNRQQLRHAPLLLLACLAKRGGGMVSKTLAETIQRPDELTEFLAVYWRDGKVPLAKQVKKGLAAAFCKFDAYQLAKYNRDQAIKLRDVLFLVHAKPKDEAQAQVWKQLADKCLPPPDTWEVELSAGKDKKAVFERLLREHKLGYLALLRNLRNMDSAKVDPALVREALLARRGAGRVLPFRYVAAARACPRWEPQLDQALLAALEDLPTLPGQTIVLVDVSGSMEYRLSARSDLTRMDAACALASIVRGDLRMFSFSQMVIEVPPRRGMAGVEVLRRSQPYMGTALAEAVEAMNRLPHDRLIVITDEQATTGGIPAPKAKHAYMINVASNKNGVGYGAWTHIDGFSENVLRWIVETEKLH